MKVLVLSITTGQGHNQVAKSLCEFFEQNDIGAVTLDTLEYVNPALKELVSRGYLMATKRVPKIYGGGYRLAEKRDADNSKEGRLEKLTTTILSRRLVRFIDDYNPDVIVCTHVFASLLISHVAHKMKPGIKTVGIVTDFTIHPYWEDTEMDYYITANHLLTNQAVKKGINEEKLVPIGIPIHPKFANKLDKQEARKALGIEDIPTVLVMSGSMGYGKIGRMIKQIDESELDFQIISVCGYNDKLKQKVDKIKFKRPIYNYGFSDKIDLFMDAADCIVTKPGGLTTSEALAKGLPMIMANPIPGQEDRNVEFLLNNGAALKVSSTFPVDEAIYQLFTNKARRETLREIVSVLGRPDSMIEFVKFIQRIVDEKQFSD